jgi:hypothetical protein
MFIVEKPINCCNVKIQYRVIIYYDGGRRVNQKIKNKIKRKNQKGAVRAFAANFN